MAAKVIDLTIPTRDRELNKMIWKGYNRPADFSLNTYRGKTVEEIISEGQPLSNLQYKAMTNATIMSSYMELYIGGDNFVDRPGYDYFLDEDWTIKVELKCTWLMVGTSNRLRISSYNQKKNKFHFMHVVDMVNDREFMVPHDDWFEQVGNRKAFYWSISYNEDDKVCKENTEWLLKYEIKDKDRC